MVGMEKLEDIARKGPDAKLAYKAYAAIMEVANPQQQLLMVNTLRRYLTRWVEISGTYGSYNGISYLASNPYFNPKLDKPLILNEITLQALGKSRPLLEGELLNEAVAEYEQAEQALRRFAHRKALERIKHALSSRTHRKEPFEALNHISDEVSLLSIISRQAKHNHDAEGGES